MDNNFNFTQSEPPKKKRSFSIPDFWLNIAIVLLTLVIAFTGSFLGVVYVCTSTDIGQSFLSLLDNTSGVNIDCINVDGISGEYTGDKIALSEKVLNHTVRIRVTEVVEGVEMPVSSGSGVILDYNEQSGETYIVTNQHVVYGAESFYVETYSGTRYIGEVLHLDEICDIAIVKIISEEKLTPARVSDSDKLKPGQDVVVAGNPRGLGLSVAFGYISHPDRDSGDMGGNLIQMDIAVNPGNSGGGAYDAQGNLIGIVISKEVGTNVEGIGYAIPSNRMLSVVSELMRYGYVKGRAALGISAYSVTSSNYLTLAQGDLAGYLPTLGTKKYGLYVESSSANIVTSQYTIQKGDRIVSADGISIYNITELRSVLARHTPYSTIDIVIERIKSVNGADIEYYPLMHITVLLGERNWADDK